MDRLVTLNKTEFTAMEKEIVRKGIHMTVAFIPALSMFNSYLTLMLLISGTAFYLLSEYFRVNGNHVSTFLSSITSIASRERDNGITLGPVTLALGSLLVLTTFNPTAAACGIYALAFGDGLSSVTGKLWGTVKIPFTKGKSVIGSLTCFFMIFLTTFGVTGIFSKSLIAAFTGAIAELIPVKDIDNLIIPFVVSMVIAL